MSARAVVEHHVRLLGLPAPSVAAPGSEPAYVLAQARAGAAIAVLEPDADVCTALGVRARPGSRAPTAMLLEREGAPLTRLRTLHPHRLLDAAGGAPVVVSPEGAAAWLWVPAGDGGVLLVGTDLAGDLVRYRQGDPARAERRETGALWGIPGERPIYLYEEQLEAERPFERYADAWALALAGELAARLGIKLEPLLPGGAPGAIVVTGDDDQAYLETYEEQLALLGPTPVTYFVHPLTKHSRGTLEQLAQRPRTELGIHPDALEAPERYPELLREQVTWFRGVTGRAPRSLRNHGYLNDGYWGHLPSWLDEGIEISANVPGVDGRVLNGSLLPARVVAADGRLAGHWSILTALGDGLVFALGLDDETAAARVHDAAARIRESGVAGVLVLNLHPQNIASTRALHRAARELAESDFVAWTLAECLDWFRARDETAGRPESRLQRLLRLTGAR